MGRRKIEIQPITHERNRSVTFLKRKNGLFKKAYELGVLCSVDVAVIVFEERPGHHVKLFQYCSTDIQNIIQRHIRHDGERDTRGPADFAPGAATKVEDADVDIVEDEDDEEEGGPSISNRGSIKRRSDGLHLDTDYMPHRSLDSPHSFPPNPAASMIQRQQGFPQRTGQHMSQRHYEQDNHHLHLTTDRHQLSPVQSKRPRIGMESPHTPTLGMYSSQQFRVPGHPSSLTQGSSHSHIQAQQSSYPDYPPFTAPSSSSQSFGSLSSRDRATGASDRSISGMTTRTVYGNVPASTSAGVSGRTDNFGFIGGTDDGRRRSATASSAGSNLGLDWPSSKAGPMVQTTERDRRSEQEKERPIERTASGSSGGGPNSGTGTSATGVGGSGWLDFLSGNGTASSGVTNAGLPSTSSPGGLSWERGSSNRTRTGGGAGSEEGTGEMDGLSLFSLNSGEAKKEGG
ncbi:hypothetical protein E4T56_gene11762 [Termitomyces sp. T112]|nr:hypothetical protein E4T56_gene11762 [Termitomyces sp. T112]